MITVYTVLQESGLKFTEQDLKHIGFNVFLSAGSKKVEINIIDQMEGKVSYRVKSYPNEFLPNIQKLILRYFKTKALKEKIRKRSLKSK